MSELQYDYWVPEEDQQRYFRVEQTLGELESNITSRNAVNCLFWQCYFGLSRLETIMNLERLFSEGLPEPEKQQCMDIVSKLKATDDSPWATLSQTHFDRILELEKKIENKKHQHINEEGISSLAIVKLCLVTILLVARRKISWGDSELFEDLISSGVTSYNLLKNVYGFEDILLSPREFRQMRSEMETEIGTPLVSESVAESSESTPDEQIENSFFAIVSLFLRDHFEAMANLGKEEEALSSFAESVAFWANSYVTLNIKEYVQSGVDCFENMLKKKSQNYNWQKIANEASLIAESFDEENSYDDHSELIQVKDATGWNWSANIYWQRASTMAENELSPSQFRQVLDAENRSRHVDRIKRDFLGDLFNTLEVDSRKALIQAEISWYDSEKMGGREAATINELRLVFEKELNSFVFSRIKEPLNRILSNPDHRKQLGIQTKDVKKISLRDMAKLLTEASNIHSLIGLPIKDYIWQLPIQKPDKEYIVSELPTFLNSLSDIRNFNEHPGTKTEWAKEINNLRRRTLGIGCESKLVRMLLIKRSVQGHNN
jgi:hypothetical protein